MILLIDNYDSFSYNLYQLIGGINPDVRVVRNDELTPDEVLRLEPSHIVISPGPGRPDAAGMIEPLIAEAAGKVPLLGVCLGHQAICETFGGKIVHAARLMHGKRSVVTLRSGGLFDGLPESLGVARYHSLAADAETLPSELKVTAVTDEGEIMAVEHKKYHVYGLQFHPESILTERGEDILRNFLKTDKGTRSVTEN